MMDISPNVDKRLLMFGISATIAGILFIISSEYFPVFYQVKFQLSCWNISKENAYSMYSNVESRV